VDQATINQVCDLHHGVPSSLEVDNGSDLVEASPLSFLPIALDITVCSHCKDVDQPAAGTEHVQRARQGGGPYGVKDDINALSRPVPNGSAYVFGPIVNYMICAQPRTYDTLAVRQVAATNTPPLFANCTAKLPTPPAAPLMSTF
jgi:hypothetical protein